MAHQYKQPHTAHRRTAGCAALLALLLLVLLTTNPATAQVISQGPTITSEGFEQRAAASTLYLTVPMHGVMAVDCPPEAVNAALKAAADDPHIQHAVFMIDSERGWPLENEHIGGFTSQLEITAVVRVALAPAIFPAFFADHIFMTETALIGGLPLHAFTARGSSEVTAKQVGIYSSMLASAAQSRGHDPAVAYAMIDQKKDLYAWRENGKTRLSNTKPEDSKSKPGFRTVENALPNSVLILDRDTAVDIGFAKPIDAFDDEIVGEYLKKPNWTPANRFGRVANGIGQVVAELGPLRDEIRELDKNLRDIRNSGNNDSSEERGYKQFKRNLDKAVRHLDMINLSLEKVYALHPERFAYFAGPDGETILADPEKWAEDLHACKLELGRASSLLREFTSGFRTLGGDAEYLYDVNQNMDEVMEHIRGIERYGNAQYWDEHAKPDLPDDVYG